MTAASVEPILPWTHRRGRAAPRKRAAPPVWRHGTRRLVPDGGASRAWPWRFTPTDGRESSARTLRPRLGDPVHERLPGLLSGGAFASTMNSSTALHAGEWRETTGLDHEVNASGLSSVESLDSRLL